MAVREGREWVGVSVKRYRVRCTDSQHLVLASWGRAAPARRRAWARARARPGGCPCSSLSERAVAGSGQARRITPRGALTAEHRGLSRTGRERGPGNRYAARPGTFALAIPHRARARPGEPLATRVLQYAATFQSRVSVLSRPRTWQSAAGSCFSSRACDGTSGVSVVAGSSCGWTPMDIPSLCEGRS